MSELVRAASVERDPRISIEQDPTDRDRTALCQPMPRIGVRAEQSPRIDNAIINLYTCGVRLPMASDVLQLEAALRMCGERLAEAGVEGPVRLFLVGGTAGLLGGLLTPPRTTADVDVMQVEPEGHWDEVRRAAELVAAELELPEAWLNDECRVYARSLPLGWLERCERTRVFGPLEVWSIGRRDFIATKIVSAPSRPQDLEDVRAVDPTEDELALASAHIDRLEREHLDPDHSLLDDARVIFEALRADP